MTKIIMRAKLRELVEGLTTEGQAAHRVQRRGECGGCGLHALSGNYHCSGVWQHWRRSPTLCTSALVGGHLCGVLVWSVNNGG